MEEEGKKGTKRRRTQESQSIEKVICDFIKARDYLVRKVLKASPYRDGLRGTRRAHRSTVLAVLEKALWDAGGLERYLVNEKDKQAFSKFTENIFLLVNFFLPAADKVLSHYMKALFYSSVDMKEIEKDLEMEVVVGIVRGLLRLKYNIVKKENFDLRKIESYIMKVARTHIKDVLPNLMLAMNIPRTCWGKIKDNKVKYSPVYLDDLSIQDGTTSLEDSQVELGDDLPLVEEFDWVTVEFRDFLSKVPEPFRRAIITKIEGLNVDFPSYVIDALARFAYEVYTKL